MATLIDTAVVVREAENQAANRRNSGIRDGVTVANDVLGGLIEMIADAVVAKLRQQGEPRLMTVTEGARYISRSERSVRQMIANGTLPCMREGRAVRLDRQTLDRWIDLRQTR